MAKLETILNMVEKRINDEMTKILAVDIPFFKEHKFSAEEHAIRYKYEGLELARDIIWDIKRENNISL